MSEQENQNTLIQQGLGECCVLAVVAEVCGG